MQSRMEKYHTKDEKMYERIRKNTKLYEEVYDNLYKDTSYRNMEVIDSAKEINLNKLKNMLDNRYDTRQYRTLKNYSKDDVEDFEKPLLLRDEKKSYDINEIIDEAKSKRTFMEEAKEKQKYIDFKEENVSRYSDEYTSLKEEEQELEELINTMVIKNQKDNNTNDALDIFSDLKGKENTIVTKPIEATFDTEIKENTTANLEKTLARADKNFYTDSNMFTKNDFEDFSTLTQSLSYKKSFIKVFKAALIIIILIVCIYLVYVKFL